MRCLTPSRSMIMALSAACASLAAGASAQDAGRPVIQGFGAVRAQKDVANRPDPLLRYRVAFEMTRAAENEDVVNPALDRVVRFVNLLGAAGIRPAAGDIVIVVHGAATKAILKNEAYRARFQRANPNTDLIRQLIAAGVAVHVCDYALGNQKFERNEVAAGIIADEAAMLTLAMLQLRGWATVAG